MLLGLKKEEIEDWNNSIHSYQKRKRTKRPFGKKQPQVQSSFKSVNEDHSLRYNPILNDFKDEREYSKTIEKEKIGKMKDQLKYLQNNYKYNVQYDIINFHPAIAAPKSKKNQSFVEEHRKKQYKDPTYNNFDIINNTTLQRKYLQKRDLKHEKKYERKIHNKNNRVYNIINGGFQDQKSNGSRVSSFSLGDSSLNGSQVLSDYDPVFRKYNRNEREDRSKSKQLYKSMNESKRYEERLPPSYRNKESVQLNPELPVPPVVQQLDQKSKLSKERYKQKHQIESQIRMRNYYDHIKRQEMTKNRVFGYKMPEAQTRQFDTLDNHSKYDISRSERFY